MTLDCLILSRLFRTLIIQYAVYLLNGHVYLFHFDMISKHTTEFDYPNEAVPRNIILL